MDFSNDHQPAHRIGMGALFSAFDLRFFFPQAARALSKSRFSSRLGFAAGEMVSVVSFYVHCREKTICGADLVC
jgi:hypothetical protein